VRCARSPFARRLLPELTVRNSVRWRWRRRSDTAPSRMSAIQLDGPGHCKSISVSKAHRLRGHQAAVPGRGVIVAPSSRSSPPTCAGRHAVQQASSPSSLVPKMAHPGWGTRWTGIVRNDQGIRCRGFVRAGSSKSLRLMGLSAGSMSMWLRAGRLFTPA
jgi:hypothetical protein